MDTYITARKGAAGSFQYAGRLQANRGKSGGSRDGPNFQMQTQIFKPNHPKSMPHVAARQSVEMNDVIVENQVTLLHTAL